MFLALIVADGEAVADFDLAAVFAANAEECADHAVLVCVPSQRVVEDREECLRSANQVSKNKIIKYSISGMERRGRGGGNGMD